MKLDEKTCVMEWCTSLYQKNFTKKIGIDKLVTPMNVVLRTNYRQNIPIIEVMEVTIEYQGKSVKGEIIFVKGNLG